MALEKGKGNDAGLVDLKSQQREDSQRQKSPEQHEASAPGTPPTTPGSSNGSNSSRNSSSPGASSGVSHSGVDRLNALLSRGKSDLDIEVKRLKDEREAMKVHKKRISLELRNTERKRQRLRARARLLSTEDLLEVYAMRARSQAARGARAPGDENHEEVQG